MPAVSNIYHSEAARDVTLPESKATHAPSAFRQTKNRQFSPSFSVYFIPVLRTIVSFAALYLISVKPKNQCRSSKLLLRNFGLHASKIFRF